MAAGNEARLLHDWTGRSAIPYREYLQAKEHDRAIQFEIEDQSSRVIATNSQLAARGFSRLQSDVAQGFSQVSEQISSVNDAIERHNDALHAKMSEIEATIQRGHEEISAALYWGFGSILGQLDVLNSTLEELVRLAKTPSQVWAFEQFAIARDEYDRSLFPESLESITRAIEGFGTFTGYRSDFRFHSLLGTLRLGKYGNASEDVVDVTIAEKAFLNAARYANSSNELEPAGHALIAAGRAAFLQGEFPRSIEHTVAGLRHCPKDVQGYYQLARAFAALGDEEHALAPLQRTFVLMPRMSVYALGEGEFRLYPELRSRAATAAMEELRPRCTELSESFDGALDSIRSLPTFGVDVNEVLESRLLLHRECQEGVRAALDTNTLLGTEDAINLLLGERNAVKDTYAALQAAITTGMTATANKFRYFLSKVEEDKRGLGNEISTQNKKIAGGNWVWFGLGLTVLGWVISVVIWFGEYGSMGTPNFGSMGRFIMHVIITPIIAFPIGVLIQVILNAFPQAAIEGKQASIAKLAAKKAAIERDQAKYAGLQRRFFETPMPDAIDNFISG